MRFNTRFYMQLKYQSLYINYVPRNNNNNYVIIYLNVIYSKKSSFSYTQTYKLHAVI